MKTICLLFAGKIEANALLYQSPLKFQKQGASFYSEYNQYRLILHISGIGTEATSIFCRDNPLSECNMIIKAGSCAVIDPVLPLLQPLIPAYSATFLNGTLGAPTNIDLPSFLNRCSNYRIDQGVITVDSMLEGNDVTDWVTNGFGMVEMEYHMIVECYGAVRCLPLLVGTDRGESDARTSFSENIDKTSRILRDTILDILR